MTAGAEVLREHQPFLRPLRPSLIMQDGPGHRNRQRDQQPEGERQPHAQRPQPRRQQKGRDHHAEESVRDREDVHKQAESGRLAVAGIRQAHQRQRNGEAIDKEELFCQPICLARGFREKHRRQHRRQQDHDHGDHGHQAQYRAEDQAKQGQYALPVILSQEDACQDPHQRAASEGNREDQTADHVEGGQRAQAVCPGMDEQQAVDDQAPRRQAEDQQRIGKADFQHLCRLVPGDQLHRGLQLRFGPKIILCHDQKVHPVCQRCRQCQPPDSLVLHRDK